jgi:hypothetical protein
MKGQPEREVVMTSASENCLYCGVVGDLTDDHVPPENLFPKPRPGNLVEVRACLACNGGASKDDEYFRQCLCLAEQTRGHDEATKNHAPVLRALNREQAPGLRASFLQSLRRVPEHTPGGLYLGHRLAFEVDLARLFRVVERTVKGLYFRETGQRLPDGYDVRVHSDETLATLDPRDLEEDTRNVIAPLQRLEPKVIGNDVFAYRHWIAPEDARISVWLLTFYRDISFLAITGPR